jgi:hypothetical protein
MISHSPVKHYHAYYFAVFYFTSGGLFVNQSSALLLTTPGLLRIDAESGVFPFALKRGA